MKLNAEFKPRQEFIKELKALSKLDESILNELESAINLLLEEGELPAAFKDHDLTRQWTGYREFHLRDTPDGKAPNELNDVLVIYKWQKERLIAVGVRIGSHAKLFSGKYRKKRD